MRYERPVEGLSIRISASIVIALLIDAIDDLSVPASSFWIFFLAGPNQFPVIFFFLNFQIIIMRRGVSFRQITAGRVFH